MPFRSVPLTQTTQAVLSALKDTRYCHTPHQTGTQHINTSTFQLPSPITKIQSPLLEAAQLKLFIKRDELIHPLIQGNKWRKLKYNLLEAQHLQQHTLLSFGGAYSNHLHALAAAGKLFGFNTIGIVRGEKITPLNPCLQDMSNWGMFLQFIKRCDYKQKNTAEFINLLKQTYGEFYLIPEGGNNLQGLKGCAELLDELTEEYDYICCEVGSGTMLSALVSANRNKRTQFIGFAVMKNPQLEQDIKNSLTEQVLPETQWHINSNYHFGGFARTTDKLDEFIHDFKHLYAIQLEPVYSGKMLYGIMDLLKQNYFPPGSRILAIHGGGLQGLRGFPQL